MLITTQALLLLGSGNYQSLGLPEQIEIPQPLICCVVQGLGANVTQIDLSINVTKDKEGCTCFPDLMLIATKMLLLERGGRQGGVKNHRHVVSNQP